MRKWMLILHRYLEMGIQKVQEGRSQDWQSLATETVFKVKEIKIISLMLFILLASLFDSRGIIIIIVYPLVEETTRRKL